MPAIDAIIEDHKPVTQHLCNEEVFSEVSAEPAETIKSVEFRLLHKVRHPCETAHTQNVECKVILARTGTKIHLTQTQNTHYLVNYSM